jgi:hypothetical protein
MFSKIEQAAFPLKCGAVAVTMRYFTASSFQQESYSESNTRTKLGADLSQAKVPSIGWLRFCAQSGLVQPAKTLEVKNHNIMRLAEGLR